MAGTQAQWDDFAKATERMDSAQKNHDRLVREAFFGGLPDRSRLLESAEELMSLHADWLEKSKPFFFDAAEK